MEQLAKNGFQKYLQYSEVANNWMNDVPSHWEVKKARYCFDERDERSETGEEEHLSLSKTRGIVPQSELTDEEHRADNLEGYKKCEPGDIVMNKMQAWNGVFGLVDRAGIVSPDYTVFTPQNDVVSDYYVHLFKTPIYISQFYWRSRGIGTAYLRLNSQFFFDIPLHHPPVEEQKKIAEYLNKFTSRISKICSEKEFLSSQIEEKSKALSSKLVVGRDKDRKKKKSKIPAVDAIPESWTDSKVGWHIHHIRNGWSPSSHSRPAINDEYGVLKLNSVSNGQFSPEHNKALSEDTEVQSDYLVSEGDVLVTRANTPELVGDACYVDESPHRLIAPDLIYIIEIDERSLMPEFFVEWLISAQARAQIKADAHGSSRSMVKISQEVLSGWRMPLPPLEEQRQIVSKIQSVREDTIKCMSEIEESIKLLREKEESLVTEIATGGVNISNSDSSGGSCL